MVGIWSMAAVAAIPDDFCLPGSWSPYPEPIVLGGGLAGFESPYVGDIGGDDGTGLDADGSSPEDSLDAEAALGAGFTVVAVHWSALEPTGPVDLDVAVPAEWVTLDRYVVLAHDRGLLPLMRISIGGEAAGPPAWVGVREAGKAAPADMGAAAAFAGKLVDRYSPGGTLAVSEGWGDTFGVRTWEFEEKPDTGGWSGQEGDYAELVAAMAARIDSTDPDAVLVGPAVSAGGDPWSFLVGALDASRMWGSPAYVAAAVPHSIGPWLDAGSFHVNEGVDGVSVDCSAEALRSTFGAFEGEPGFEYAPKEQFWQTEGHADPALDESRSAWWRWQTLTRAFAAGVTKVTISDPTPAEVAAVRRYTAVLPDPLPMEVAQVACCGDKQLFVHDDADGLGKVWIVWAGTGNPYGTLVQIPVTNRWIVLLRPDGSTRIHDAGTVTPLVHLWVKSDPVVSQPVLVIDRPLPIAP